MLMAWNISVNQVMLLTFEDLVDGLSTLDDWLEDSGDEVIGADDGLESLGWGD